MARCKKAQDVAKFGGVDQLGEVKLNGHRHDAASIEAKSDLKLEADIGEGNAIVVRCFTFQMNLEKPELFIERNPSKQDLFNSHLRGIETMLWRDGLKIYDKVTPRITFDVKKFQYSIFVASVPSRGQVIYEKPQTLSEIIHG